MRRINHRILIALFCLICSISPAFSAKNYFDIRIGYGTHSTEVSNTKHLYIAPNLDLNLGFKTGPYLSHINLSYWSADTNATHLINGTVTNTRLSNRIFYARAWSFSFTEYVPFTFFKRLDVMPGVDVKFAHYNDISAGSEFLSPSTDYMYMFLRLALRAEYTYNQFSGGFEFKYPILSLLTDKLWEENRNENMFHIFGTFHYSDFYARIGYDRSSLTYSNRVTNGAGWPYRYRIQNSLYLAVGIEF